MEVFSNTLQFRFPTGSLPPSWMEIAEFTKRIHTDVLQVEVVYKFPPQRSLCVKYKSREAMEETLGRNVGAIKFHYTDGRIVDVDVSVAGSNVVYTRLFDLPPEVHDDVLVAALSEYGKVGKVVHEKFPAGLGLDHRCSWSVCGIRDRERDSSLFGSDDMESTSVLRRAEGEVFFVQQGGTFQSKLSNAENENAEAEEETAASFLCWNRGIGYCSTVG